LDLNQAGDVAGCGRFQWSYKNAEEIEPVLWRAADIQGLRQVAPPDTRCFVGALNNEQCYLSLVSSRGFGIPGRGSVVFAAEAEAYVGNCVTLDAYRGMGIYPCGLAELGARLQKEGRRWLYLFVERENLASIRGVEKAGFCRIAESSVFQWRGRSRQRWHVLTHAEDVELVRRWEIKPDS
jgi:ribosomal protein S18 acetylase RimI-like enzyme